MSTWDETVWRAIDGATVLQQGSHFPGSRSNERSEKREERRDEKKKPPEMPKLIDSRVCWPQGRLESLHFCRMSGLAGREKKATARKGKSQVCILIGILSTSRSVSN